MAVSLAGNQSSKEEKCWVLECSNWLLARSYCSNSLHVSERNFLSYLFQTPFDSFGQSGRLSVILRVLKIYSDSQMFLQEPYAVKNCRVVLLEILADALEQLQTLEQLT